VSEGGRGGEIEGFPHRLLAIGHTVNDGDIVREVVGKWPGRRVLIQPNEGGNAGGSQERASDARVLEHVEVEGASEPAQEGLDTA